MINNKTTKTPILFVFLILSAFASLAQTGMHFEKTSFDEIKAKAKKENKLIFMDCYTTWCGPCKKMSNETFTDSRVGEYFNARFINAKFDMEDGEGLTLANTYQVMCYPNLLILDAEGNLLHRSAGYKDSDGFIDFAKIANDPIGRFSGLQKQYEQNPESKKIIQQYLTALEASCLPTDELAKKYLKLLSPNDYSKSENWAMIAAFATEFESDAFQYVLKNLDFFKKEHTEDSVKNYVMNVVYNQTKQIGEAKNYDPKTFDNFINKLRDLHLSFLNETEIFNIKLYLHSGRSAWADYIKVAMLDGDQYLSIDMTNGICWNFYLHASDKAAFVKAASWMNKYITNKKEIFDWVMDNNKTVPKYISDMNVDASNYDRAKSFLAQNELYPQYDTYAAILYKLKNKKEAANYANLAISIGKKYELDYAETENLLKEIMKLK